MKTKFNLLAIGGSLLISVSGLVAQPAGTNSLPLDQTLKYQVALENDRSLGERALLPPGLKEKLKLTDDQREELKPIEDDFAKTSLEYQAANEPRIYAALEAKRLARISRSAEKIAQARKQLQQVYAGLQPYRAEEVRQIKVLLTPEQVIILEDPQNQWHENHVAEANDPSAN